MKKICSVLIAGVLLALLSVFASAAEFEKEQEQLWLGGLYDAVDGETRELLESIGIGEVDADTLIGISPGKVFGLLRDILVREASSPFSAVLPVLGLLLLCALVTTFAGEGQLSELCGTVGVLCVMFAVVLSSCDIFSQTLSSVLVTKDFMLCLLPAFCGVLAFSGGTLTAAGFSAVMLAFAGTVSVTLAAGTPVFCAADTALAAAAALDPFFDLSPVVKLLNKAVTSVLAFVSSVFTAVLGIKGTVAAAADTVGLKGLKFIVGSSVPIVGSAIGDALNTLTAGLGLIKHTAGAFGIAVLLLINLPPLLRLIVWKTALFLLSTCAGMLGNGRVKTFVEALNGLYSVVCAVIFFNMFVFVVGLIVVLTLGKGS